MGMNKIENFLEDHIEGFFNRKFSSDLQPAELMNGIEKEIGRQGKGKPRAKVPNHYEFTVSPEDYQRFCAQRVIDDLYEAVEKQVIFQDYTMDGDLQVFCRAERKQAHGTYKLRSFFDGQPSSDTEEAQTIVVRKQELTPKTMAPNRDYKTASLTVVEGPDYDAYLEFGEKKIYIGRQEQNEFILTDQNASRLHAWIAYEHHRHVLYDAQSTNGTFVNGSPVQSYCLCDGDEIQVGATVLLYEVII